MSFRYRKRIKLLPGIHLNISKSGISTSIGVRGASMTFGKRGTYMNAGVPGTGISYRERLKPSEPHVTETPIAATSDTTTVHHHHLHWWKVGLFFVTMILAGLTKNDGVIGLFWFGWTAYWLFLFVRFAIRSIRKGPQRAEA